MRVSLCLHKEPILLLIFFCALSLLATAKEDRIDSIANHILEAKDAHQYDLMTELGMSLIEDDYQELAKKDYSPYIFSYTATALSHIGKFAVVPQLALKGYPLVEKFLTKNDAEYYSLPCCEITAHLMMGQPERADSIYEKLESALSGMDNAPDDVRTSLPQLQKHIKLAYQQKWSGLKQNRLTRMKDMANRMVGIPPTTDAGTELWKDYLEWMRENISFFYLDINDSQDEVFWNHSLATLLTCFYVCCDEMPNRTMEAYDNVLVSKNFLDYHMGNLHKKRVRWGDVQNMLSDGEVAIELCVLPEEVLIIKKGFNIPLSIRIDSTMIEELEAYNGEDPLKITKTYANGGALYRLWQLIEESIGDANTIYLAASHFLTQFNYGAIHTQTGQIVADRYDFHYLVSTADIAHVKSLGYNQSYSSAVLFGDITYDTNQSDMKRAASIYREQEHQNWDLTSDIDENTRAGFAPLIHSKQEIKVIENALSAVGVDTKVLLGTAANEEAFKQLSHKASEIIHMSTHGFMVAPTYQKPQTTEQEEQMPSTSKYASTLLKSGLLLSGANHVWKGERAIEGVDDGILTSKEIAEMDLRSVKLSVLSACKTGIGNDTNLTGVSYGPQHAMKTAGVDKIVMSLWMVDDEATSLLMQHFYQHLLAGNDVRVSLRNAQKQLISEGYIDPYYWASFVVLE